jgi:hypothetical protein
MTYDPNRPDLDPPAYRETVETVVVRDKDSSAGWWIAGVLGALLLLALIWFMVAGRGDPVDDANVRAAEAAALQAQADADRALIEGQVAGAQQTVDLARADAARAQAEASRAAADARAAEARAATPPVVITTPSPEPAEPTVTPPQN